MTDACQGLLVADRSKDGNWQIHKLDRRMNRGVAQRGPVSSVNPVREVVLA